MQENFAEISPPVMKLVPVKAGVKKPEPVKNFHRNHFCIVEPVFVRLIMVQLCLGIIIEGIGIFFIDLIA